MLQFGGKDSKRNFTVVIGGKEHGLYVSSSPSSAARKAVTKLCTANKSKKVDFYIREITQGSKKKTYGPYLGHIEKLKEPIELKGRVIRYKPVAKLSKETSKKSAIEKRSMRGGQETFANSLRLLINDILVLDLEKKIDKNILLGLDIIEGKIVQNPIKDLAIIYQTIKQKLRNKQDDREHHGVNFYSIKNLNSEENIIKFIIASAVYSELTRIKGNPQNAKDILDTFVNYKFEKPIPVHLPLAIYYLYFRYFDNTTEEVEKYRSKLDEIISKITNDLDKQILLEKISR